MVNVSPVPEEHIVIQKNESVCRDCPKGKTTEEEGQTSPDACGKFERTWVIRILWSMLSGIVAQLKYMTAYDSHGHKLLSLFLISLVEGNPKYLWP